MSSCECIYLPSPLDTIVKTSTASASPSGISLRPSFDGGFARNHIEQVRGTRSLDLQRQSDPTKYPKGDQELILGGWNNTIENEEQRKHAGILNGNSNTIQASDFTNLFNSENTLINRLDTDSRYSMLNVFNSKDFTYTFDVLSNESAYSNIFQTNINTDIPISYVGDLIRTNYLIATELPIVQLVTNSNLMNPSTCNIQNVTYTNVFNSSNQGSVNLNGVNTSNLFNLNGTINVNSGNSLNGFYLENVQLNNASTLNVFDSESDNLTDCTLCNFYQTNQNINNYNFVNAFGKIQNISALSAVVSDYLNAMGENGQYETNAQFSNNFGDNNKITISEYVNLFGRNSTARLVSIGTILNGTGFINNSNSALILQGSDSSGVSFIENSSFSSILSGQNNGIDRSNYSTIYSGHDNRILNSDYCSILSGHNHTIENRKNVIIGSGENITPDADNEFVVHDLETRSALHDMGPNSINDSVFIFRPGNLEFTFPNNALSTYIFSFYGDISGSTPIIHLPSIEDTASRPSSSYNGMSYWIVFTHIGTNPATPNDTYTEQSVIIRPQSGQTVSIRNFNFEPLPEVIVKPGTFNFVYSNGTWLNTYYEKLVN